MLIVVLPNAGPHGLVPHLKRKARHYRLLVRLMDVLLAGSLLACLVGGFISVSSGGWLWVGHLVSAGFCVYGLTRGRRGMTKLVEEMETDPFAEIDRQAEALGLGPGEFYDKTGLPLSMGEWSRRMQTPGYGEIASEVIDGVALVSTVWFGQNMSIAGILVRAGAFDAETEARIDTRPLIFETMVFLHQPVPAALSEIDRLQFRYATEQEAIAGHQKAVELVRAAIAQCL